MNIDELTAKKEELESQLAAVQKDSANFETAAKGFKEKYEAEKVKSADVAETLDAVNKKHSILFDSSETLKKDFAAYKADEKERVEKAVAEQLSAAVQESLKTELPKAAAKAGFSLDAPKLDKDGKERGEAFDNLSPSERLEKINEEKLAAIGKR